MLLRGVSSSLTAIEEVSVPTPVFLEGKVEFPRCIPRKYVSYIYLQTTAQFLPRTSKLLKICFVNK